MFAYRVSESLVTVTVQDRGPAPVVYRIVGSYDTFDGVPSSSEPGWYEDTGAPISVGTSKNGSIEVEFWARDAAGNASVIQSSGTI